MLQLIPLLLPLLSKVVSGIIPDKDRQVEIEKEIKLALLEHTDSLEKVRGDIILAEAGSENWITSSWRPLLMMIIIAIVAMNYLVFPLLTMFTGVPLAIDLPIELWNLLQIGVGGYIVGRSGEKMVDKWKDK